MTAERKKRRATPPEEAELILGGEAEESGQDNKLVLARHTFPRELPIVPLTARPELKHAVIETVQSEAKFVGLVLQRDAAETRCSKTIAAKRAKVKDLVFPAENEKDFEELPDHIRRGLKPCFVKSFEEVVRICFGTCRTARAEKKR